MSCYQMLSSVTSTLCNVCFSLLHSQLTLRKMLICSCDHRKILKTYLTSPVILKQAMKSCLISWYTTFRHVLSVSLMSYLSVNICTSLQ